MSDFLDKDFACDEAGRGETAKQRALIEMLVDALEQARGSIEPHETFTLSAIDAALAAAKEQSA